MNRSLKPACLSCLGDISLAIGAKFEIYLHPAMNAIATISAGLQYFPHVDLKKFKISANQITSLPWSNRIS